MRRNSTRTLLATASAALAAVLLRDKGPGRRGHRAMTPRGSEAEDLVKKPALRLGRATAPAGSDQPGRPVTFQVRFHGRGGQGVVTAAELLAAAALS